MTPSPLLAFLPSCYHPPHLSSGPFFNAHIHPSHSCLPSRSYLSYLSIYGLFCLSFLNSQIQILWIWIFTDISKSRACCFFCYLFFYALQPYLYSSRITFPIPCFFFSCDKINPVLLWMESYACSDCSWVRPKPLCDLYTSNFQASNLY